MAQKQFSYPNGKKFKLPLVYVGDEKYHYVRIEDKNIKSHLPAVLASMKDKTAPDAVTAHWTAGNYNHAYNSYQLNVCDGYILINILATSYEFFHHTWKRNSKKRGHGLNNFGICYTAMGGGFLKNTGMYAQDIRKKPAMIETFSQCQAVLKQHFGLKWNQFLDHDTWSKRDNYDADRWDNRLQMKEGSLYEINMRKSKWYYDQWFNSNSDKKMPETARIYKTENREKYQNLVKYPPVSKAETLFDDVSREDWFADAVQFVVDKEIMIGIKTPSGGHAFEPHKAISRAQMAIVARELYKTINQETDAKIQALMAASKVTKKDYQTNLNKIQKEITANKGTKKEIIE